MKRFVTLLLALCMILGMMVPAAMAAPAETNDPFIDLLSSMYASENLEVEYRPDVRWWLAEGLHTDETLKKNIQEIYDNGFGAAEFLAMTENGAPDNIYGWGSEEWIADSQLIVKEAAKLGLGFSLTSGTHWANANLPDTYVWDGEPYNADNKAASKELDYATIRLEGGQQFNGVLPFPVKPSGGCGGAPQYEKHDLVSVTAGKVLTARRLSGTANQYSEGSGVGVLDLDSMIDLTDAVVLQEDGSYTLNWTAPEDGNYAIFAYWLRGTSQTADPSVSKNYTVNYMDSYGIEALIDYWEEYILTDELVEVLKSSGRGEIYMDSLEVSTNGAGGLFWGIHFKDEFEARMGYDITPYLPFISASGGGQTGSNTKEYDYVAANDEDNAKLAKVKADYYSVMTDMYEENVLEPLQTWLHSLNMTLRAEPSYGFNFEISTPAKYIDGIETETFAQNGDIELYRGIQGGANMYGRLFSSETGAVGEHNYTLNMDQWTQMCYLQFVNGVNRTVFHGYSAIEGSEGDTKWPGHEGMMSMFSERWNSRQPTSILFPEWTEMLTRNQKVLRQGNPARDIAILRTDYAFINYGFANGWDSYDNNYQMHDTPYYWNDLELQHNGYTYDYFSPMLLTDEENVEWTADALQPNGPSYQAIVLYQEELEYEAAEKILEIAEDGLPVLFVNNNTETLAHNGAVKAHGTAASVSRHSSNTDEELQAVVAQIKALPNVATVDSPADAMEKLQEMGVYARVGFEEATDEVLTVSRNDEENDIFYTFAYAFKAQMADAAPTNTVTLSVEGEGKPYMINDWTGEVTALADYDFVDGRTELTLNLDNGEAALLAFDMSEAEAAPIQSTTADEAFIEDGTAKILVTESGAYTTVMADGTTVSANIEVPEKIALDTWDIVIEDWNEGEKVTMTEEKFGHTTTEVYYTTKKTELSFPQATLASWKNLPATQEQLATLATPSMADVSGIGTYTTTFEVPENWADGAVLCIESTNGSAVQVYVNGEKANGVDVRTLTVDISDLLVEGENTIEIILPTTLHNRLLQRKYSPLAVNVPQDYGMVGEVAIVPYVIADADFGTSVTLNVTGETAVTLEDDLAYTVTASNANGLATATLTFAVEGVEPTVVPAEGWYALAQTFENGVLEVVLCNNAGLTGEGDLVTLTAPATGKVGTVSVELTDAVLSAYMGEAEGFVPAVMGDVLVETTVDYSPFDVNKDGTVNQLDITRAQRFFGTDDPICNVDGEGTVSISDLVLIMNNYSK